MEQSKLDQMHLLDAEQVGKLLRLDVRTVYKMARCGDLPRLVISGRTVRFEPAAVRQWVRDKRE